MKHYFRIFAFVALTAIFVAPSGKAHAFGDMPDSYFDPLIDVGCWRWNWYQHANYNVCPVYVHPKAYMFPRRSPVALRVKG